MAQQADIKPMVCKISINRFKYMMNETIRQSENVVAHRFTKLSNLTSTHLIMQKQVSNILTLN